MEILTTETVRIVSIVLIKTPTTVEKNVLLRADKPALDPEPVIQYLRELEQISQLLPRGEISQLLPRDESETQEEKRIPENENLEDFVGTTPVKRYHLLYNSLIFM